MHKTDIEKIAILPLVIVLLITGARFLRFQNQKTEIEEVTEIEALSPLARVERKPAEAPSEAEKGEIISKAAVQYQGKEGRDPFSSPMKKRLLSAHELSRSEEIPHLTLNGIVWNVDKPIAIVNNKILRKGDSIEGAEVLDITQAGVSLRFEAKQIMLKPKRLEGKDNGGRGP